MAFGFVRNAGRARSYTNVSAADGPVPIGSTISRRQYDKYVERLGARTHLPGTAAIRETERNLEELRRWLAAEQIEAEEVFEVEAELQRQRFANNGAQARGQRRYNAALESFVRHKRSQGIQITKREARSTAEFRQVMTDIKGTPNKRGNPNVRDRNAARRRAAFDRIGGGRNFKEVYDTINPTPVSGPRRVVDQTGRTVVVTPRRRVA